MKQSWCISYTPLQNSLSTNLGSFKSTYGMLDKGCLLLRNLNWTVKSRINCTHQPLFYQAWINVLLQGITERTLYKLKWNNFLWKKYTECFSHLFVMWRWPTLWIRGCRTVYGMDFLFPSSRGSYFKCNSVIHSFVHGFLPEYDTMNSSFVIAIFFKYTLIFLLIYLVSNLYISDK